MNSLQLSVAILIATITCLSPSPAYADGTDYELPDYKDHPCIRACEDGAPSRLCKYTWVLENYYILSKACHECPFNLSHCYMRHCVPGDGVSRGIKTANRVMPGPPVEVCEGDTVEVTVDNRMEVSEGTSIHWHGLTQRGSQYMDGVAMVTQCPIPASSRFTYSNLDVYGFAPVHHTVPNTGLTQRPFKYTYDVFELHTGGDKFKPDSPGTHFWHAHTGVQRADGLYGAFIVRSPPGREPHYRLYDYDLSEHVMIVTDWLAEMTVNRFAAHHHDDGDNKPELMLINGMGKYQEFKDDNGTSYFTPRATFTVKGGKKYRFRVISSAILNCPIQISIEGHTMTVIASDGNSFEPIVVDTFNIFAGERFDFVLYADKIETPRNYLIKVLGLADCTVKAANQTAILKYEGAPDALLPESTPSNTSLTGLLLNPWNAKGTATQIELTRMVNTEPDDVTLTAEPDKKFYLAMDFNKIDNWRFNNPKYYPLSSVVKNKQVFSPQINHISSMLPASPPLTQYDDVPKDKYCNAETVQKHCELEWCTCVHMYQVSLGDLVELVLIDEGVTFDANHPMHLHGYKFRVVGMYSVNTSTSLAEIKAMDKRGELKRLKTKALLKDTVIVPDGGYTIVRFKADNPGIWFFHCHIEFHAEIGMGLLFQVGTKEQFPKPPRNFPTCGNWLYDDDAAGGDVTEQCLTRNSGGSRTFSVFGFIVIFTSKWVLN